MPSLTEMRNALTNMQRGVENELDTHNANQLKDEAVFDRQSTARGKRSKLAELRNRED